MNLNEYEFGTMRIIIAIPKGQKCCKYCRFCEDDPRMRQRRICKETFEILYDINRIGDRCPIKWEGTIDEIQGAKS